MRTIELNFGDANNYFIREAFNTLRTNILFSGKNVKTILITSCLAHEGKTTVSFELAKSFAEANKKVLLIDADLRKSVTVSRYTKERGITGLSQLLSGQVEIDQAVCRTQLPDLDMIFAGPFPPNPSELVGSPTFKELLDCVRDAYDYIIIDAPPLGLVIDATVMASVCDGAVIVINQGNIKFRVAQNVKAQLSKSGCRILGVVLNQTQRKKRSIRGSRDAYYSKYKYGEYYEMDASKQMAGTDVTRRPSPQAPNAQRPAQQSPSAQPRPATGTPARPTPGAPRPTVGTERPVQRNVPPVKKQ